VCQWFAHRLTSNPILDALEATCQCAADLGVAAADVQHAVWRMVDDGCVTLVSGWMVAAASVPFIDLADLPTASMAFAAPPPLPLQAPLEIFRRLVVVLPEASSSPSPVPSSCSVHASQIYASEDAFRAEVTQTFLRVSKRLGASVDAMQLSSAIVEQEGSLSRALFKLAGAASAGQGSMVVPKSVGMCNVCLNENETILHAPCGHGMCAVDWEGQVLVALQDSSTTKVKTGEENLLDISKLKCAAAYTHQTPQLPPRSSPCLSYRQ